MSNKHQPYLTPFGLYYCVADGADSNGRIQWRVTYEGNRINNGELIFENSVVECSPHVFVGSGGSYTMSFVTRFARGNYHLGVVTSRTPDFAEITSTRLVSPVPIATLLCEETVFTVHTRNGGFILSGYNYGPEMDVSIRHYVAAPWEGQYIPCRISCLADCRPCMLITFINPSDEDDFFSVVYDVENTLLSSPIQIEGQHIYKSSILQTAVVHAVKGDGGFEDRELYAQPIDMESLEWNPAELLLPIVVPKVISRLDSQIRISHAES